MEPTIRKTIRFPRALVERLCGEAATERRSFSQQVILMLEQIFGASTVRQSEEEKQ